MALGKSIQHFSLLSPKNSVPMIRMTIERYGYTVCQVMGLQAVPIIAPGELGGWYKLIAVS